MNREYNAYRLVSTLKDGHNVSVNPFKKLMCQACDFFLDKEKIEVYYDLGLENVMVHFQR